MVGEKRGRKSNGVDSLESLAKGVSCLVTKLKLEPTNYCKWTPKQQEQFRGCIRTYVGAYSGWYVDRRPFSKLPKNHPARHGPYENDLGFNHKDTLAAYLEILEEARGLNSGYKGKPR